LTTRGANEEIAKDIARLIYRYLKGEINKDLAISIVKRTVSLLKPLASI
jgi:hypothetical protein